MVSARKKFLDWIYISFIDTKQAYYVFFAIGLGLGFYEFLMEI